MLDQGKTDHASATVLKVLRALPIAIGVAGSVNASVGHEMSLAAVREAVTLACTEEGLDCSGNSTVLTSSLIDGSDLRHYQFSVAFADGSSVGIHRVVEVGGGPWNRPVASDQAAMLAHGDVWSFAPAFLNGAPDPVTGIPAAGDSVAVHLANSGIDVWGIDFGWTRLAAGADTSALASWGVERDAADLGLAMSVARKLRNSSSKLHLMGWSRGGITGYAYASLESSKPVARKHVRTFIPVDVYVEPVTDDHRSKACARLEQNLARMAAGETANDSSLILYIGQMAASNPAGTSDVLPWLTNAGAADFVLAATYNLLAPAEPTPYYHLFAGDWSSGSPGSLMYVDSSRAYGLMAAGSPYEPLLLMAESDAATCDDASLLDVAFDDRIARIRMPVLYVGAAGGFGASGLFTATRVSSRIVESHVVQFETEANSLLDVGHADIFHADLSASNFWEPIKDFMMRH